MTRIEFASHASTRRCIISQKRDTEKVGTPVIHNFIVLSNTYIVAQHTSQKNYSLVKYCRPRPEADIIVKMKNENDHNSMNMQRKIKCRLSSGARYEEVQKLRKRVSMKCGMGNEEGGSKIMKNLEKRWKVEMAINELDVKCLVITTTFKIDQRPKNNRERGRLIHTASSPFFS